MKNENLVPKVRFKGFSDPWEQRKLGDITAITMGQSPSSANYTNNPEDHILVQGNADMKNGYVLPRVWTTQITKKAEAGDLILSVRAPVGDIGKTDYDVVLGRGVASIKGNEFIYQTLKYMNDIGKWTRFSTGSTFESINSADIKDARIGYPKLNEQNLIGNILEKMDSIIAANEDKLEQLKTLKKLMMQKIFSQEWRFKGFTDPWEQRKLLEIADRLSKSSNSENLAHVEYADIISGEGRLKSESLIQKRTDSRSGIQFVAQNVLYGKLRPYLNNWLFPNFPGIAVGDFWVFQTKKGIFAPFLYALIQSPKYQQVANISTGTKMPRSDWKKVSGIHFEVPIEFNEQRKIGHFFLRLDSLIAANEDKLNQLKELKKYLMQNMFV